MLAFYKCSSQLSKKHLRVCHPNEPAIDTGGVHRETYTTVFSEFVHNDHIHLFDGLTNHLRPYLSPLCYWYIAKGGDEALQYARLDDVGEASVALVSKVQCIHCVIYGSIIYKF